MNKHFKANYAVTTATAQKQKYPYISAAKSLIALNI